MANEKPAGGRPSARRAAAPAGRPLFSAVPEEGPSDGDQDPIRADAADIWSDRFKFQDDIYGEVFFNRLEHDVIDTPEFQRLFRVSQLGLIDLVYQTANHTRGAHSIGTCHVAKKLVRLLNENRQHLLHVASNRRPPSVPHVSQAEAILIRLGALLHDIPHAPYSHDIERKSHRHPTYDGEKTRSAAGAYDKHDDYARNATFFVLIADPSRSVLARVLRHYSPAFHACVLRDAAEHDHLSEFRKTLTAHPWSDVESELLPQLLLHLFVFERPEDGSTQYEAPLAHNFDTRPQNWGLGPPGAHKEYHLAWYQPYRHDVIGNTLSADLLDYLLRDIRHLGLNRGLDQNLLNSYVLAKYVPSFSGIESDASRVGSKALYRCALDLDDYKRGTFRTEPLNDLFRLLDLRHEIHEKAVNHRVVQSAVAMMSRCIQLLGEDRRPKQQEIIGIGRPTAALSGDEQFLSTLFEHSRSADGEDGVIQSLLRSSVNGEFIGR